MPLLRNGAADGAKRTAATSGGRGTGGMGASDRLQVSRRTAVTAVAVVATTGWPCASFCSTPTVQCWVERLVRTGCSWISNGPSLRAPA
jgi:hypothetical protein